MEIASIQNLQRTCKDCGQPLGPGRDDRQYCDSACKTNYNNRRRRVQNPADTEPAGLTIPDYITRIQDIVLANRSILERLCTEEKAGNLHIRDLLGKGFNLKYFSSEAEPTAAGHIYRFCFEYGYYINEDSYVVIVCRKREVN